MYPQFKFGDGTGEKAETRNGRIMESGRGDGIEGKEGSRRKKWEKARKGRGGDER